MFQIKTVKAPRNYPYFVTTGTPESLKALITNGVKGLNLKTERAEIISFDARFKIVKVETFKGTDGRLVTSARLFCNKDLKALAMEKRLKL